MSTDDPDWDALHRKIASWEARMRARSEEIQKLDDRLRDLEHRMQTLRARLAKGTGVMASVVPEGMADRDTSDGDTAEGNTAEGSGPTRAPTPRR